MFEIKPKMRPIDAIPVEIEGEGKFVVRDPEEISTEALIVPPVVLYLLTMFDGENTIDSIGKIFALKSGQAIPPGVLEELLANLDQYFYLDNEKYRARRAEIESQFLAEPVRPARFAGKAYEDDPERLDAQIQSFFESPNGVRSDGAFELPHAPLGLVAPHIDPHRGGPCASYVLNVIASHEPADLYIIFGTAHQPTPLLYTMSLKDFATPYGKVEVDLEFANELEKRYGRDLRTGEFAHRGEHSIEFQVVYLHHALRNRKPFKILPILCGSFHQYLLDKKKPEDDPVVQEFVAAIRATAQALGRNVCYIAGADLSHIGRKFGDPLDLSDDLIEAVSTEDQEMLSHVERGDRSDLFDHLVCDGDARKVCGFPPIYTMLSCLGDDTTGKLLKYDIAVEPDTQSLVSFCSMAFY